ncbi:hypothetical protein ACSAZL_12365 [Methanosarcina sp. T3]|uniref:hypothetical protein n=1 Tax=Methanosarcina sp. T3 TaxID=3439062 RepID=UPI003F83790D
MPEGTIIKDGILTYPAKHYLTEDPLLLGLENYGKDNETQTSCDSPNTVYLEKGCVCFADSSGNIISRIPDAGSLWLCPSSILSIYYCRNVNILQPGFAILCCSTSPSFNLIALSTPLNATSN